MTTRFDAGAFLRRFWKMDATLVERGFPPISEWWRHQITRFIHALASGTRRWIIRAGRRAGKSTTLCRLAVAWAWFGVWYVPPGDEVIVSFVSVNRDESAARLKTIDAIATALGLEHDARGDDVVLTAGRNATFRTFAATTKAVVGHTSIAIFGDEVARWESRDAAANPAREVLGSLRPTLATQEFGFEVASSSPWGSDDYHAEMFDAGETDHQVTSFAPTWVANPTLSEKRTHELEPDERTWSREYAAEPGATVTAAIDPEDVAACFGRGIPLGLAGAFAAIDASSLRGDGFTYICGRLTRAQEIVVTEVDGWEGAALRHVLMADVVRKISERVKAVRAPRLFGDQREEAALTTLFSQRGVLLKTFAWSEPSKDEAMQLLRRLMRERRVYLPDHAELRHELTSMKARLLPSGRIRYETSGLDYASCLVTLAHAIVAKDLRVDGSDGVLRGQAVRSQVSRFLDETDHRDARRGAARDAEAQEFAAHFGLTLRRLRVRGALD